MDTGVLFCLYIIARGRSLSTAEEKTRPNRRMLEVNTERREEVSAADAAFGSRIAAAADSGRGRASREARVRECDTGEGRVALDIVGYAVRFEA